MWQLSNFKDVIKITLLLLSLRMISPKMTNMLAKLLTTFTIVRCCPIGCKWSVRTFFLLYHYGMIFWNSTRKITTEFAIIFLTIRTTNQLTDHWLLIESWRRRKPYRIWNFTWCRSRNQGRSWLHKRQSFAIILLVAIITCVITIWVNIRAVRS